MSPPSVSRSSPTPPWSHPLPHPPDPAHHPALSPPCFQWEQGDGRGLPKDSANLARIRDNQRRSRARRKEYVQDLEARLRKVELQGVEAATEIQIAARRVADENRRLRALLGRHGVGDDAIERYLVASGIGFGDGRGGPDGGSVGRTVIALEQLLVPRKPSCGSLSVPMRPRGGGSPSREASVASDPTGRNINWDGMTGGSPEGVSPLSNIPRQITAPVQSPAMASGMHHVGGYTIEGQSSGDHSPYSIDYDAGTQIPYVQLSSPQEYDSIPVDYFSQPRGFTQGQYPC